MEPTAPGIWEDLARTHFRVPSLRPFQTEVIAALLAGESPRILVVMPTGSGKSLCFTLPALVNPGPSLVIYPLKALMKDQIRRFRALDLPCGLLQGGQTKTQRAEVFSGLKTGKIRFLVTNPEVLQQPRILRELEGMVWSQVILDEVHCVTTWGETFRPAYLALREALRHLKFRVLAGFTATAGPLVRARIQDLIFSPEPAREMVCNPDRPNIHYLRWPTRGRLWALEKALMMYPRPALVFCRTREATRMIAVHLARVSEGIPTRFYHAGLTQEEKSALQDWFYSTQEGILCTTKAFGMGVDKPDIRTVIHWDLPETLEDFLQESGRGGRDGGPAWSLLLEEVPPKFGSEVIKIMNSTPGCLRKSLLSPLGWTGETCGACGSCLGISLPPAPLGVPSSPGRTWDTRSTAHLLWGRKNRSVPWWLRLFGPAWGSEESSSLEALEQINPPPAPPERQKWRIPGLPVGIGPFFFLQFLAKSLRKG